MRTHLVLDRRLESKREWARTSVCLGSEPVEGPVGRPKCDASQAWRNGFMLYAWTSTVTWDYLWDQSLQQLRESRYALPWPGSSDLHWSSVWQAGEENAKGSLKSTSPFSMTDVSRIVPVMMEESCLVLRFAHFILRAGIWPSRYKGRFWDFLISSGLNSELFLLLWPLGQVTSNFIARLWIQPHCSVSLNCHFIIIIDL